MTKDDPILAIIQEHKEAEDALEAYDDSDKDQSHALVKLTDEIAMKLVSPEHMPRTLAGMAALLKYSIDHENNGRIWPDDWDFAFREAMLVAVDALRVDKDSASRGRVASSKLTV